MMKQCKKIIVVIFMLSFVHCVLASTDDKLAHVLSSIKDLKHNLSLSINEKNSAESELKKIDLQLAATSKQFYAMKHTLQHKRRQLTDAQTRLDKERALLSKQKENLAKSVSALYMLGHQSYLKLMLSQNQISDTSRYMMYYRYLVKSELQQIETIQKTLQRISDLVQSIRAQEAKMEKAYAHVAHLKYQLQHEKNIRTTVIKRLNNEITSKQQKLNQLIQDKQRLNAIVHEVRSSGFYVLSGGKSFRQNKHDLPWPLYPVHLIRTYGASIARGHLRSSGILLGAPEGAAVRAVFPGKVVFADWLRGFGLLVIVQHSKDYMTLYAHAESLYVQQGDSVALGQEIATAGNSGGAKYSGIYFEIRYKGRAENPLIWLRKNHG